MQGSTSSQTWLGRRRNIGKLRWAIRAALVTVLVILVWPIVPRVANHFGFALPFEGGLPYRIWYGGRNYMTDEMCAGAGWCSGKWTCRSEQYLAKRKADPLVDAGSVPTLLWLEHRIVAGPASYPGGLPFTVYVQYYDNCYISYGISGEP